MLSYLYNMAKRMEKLLAEVTAMNRKYDLLLEKLDRIESSLRNST